MIFLVQMVASKFLNDDGEEDEVFNMEWAKSGDLTIGEINRLEKDFLGAIVSIFIDCGTSIDSLEMFKN